MLFLQIFIINIFSFGIAKTYDELKDIYITREEWETWQDDFNLNFKGLDDAINQKLYNEIRYEYWARDLKDDTDPVVYDKQIEQYNMKKQATVYGVAQNVYSVAFVTNGGMWKAGKQPLMYRKGNEETLLPTSADIHYGGKVFVGWYDNINFDGDVVTTVTNDKNRPTIYFAKWRNLNPGETEEDYSSQYKINYFLNGGSWNGYTPAQYRQPLTSVTLPNSSQVRKTGYDFMGWYETSDFSTPVVTSIQTSCDTDKTFYAKWQEATYTINYHYEGTLSGFTLKNSRLYHESVSLPTSTHVARPDYVFIGWYANSSYTGTKYTSIPANTVGNFDLYLKWVKEKYPITLVTNGGSYVAGYTEPTERSYLTSFTLPTNDNMKYTGKKLVGWYDNPSFSGSPVLSIPANTEGEKTYYAKWEEMIYTMNYHLDHGTTSASLPATRKYSVSITLPNNDKMTPAAGYKFRGWFADAGHTTLVTKVAANTEIKDVYAGFEPMNSWSSVSYSSWMSKIPDDMYLSEINIPGAHDAGCKEVESAATLAALVNALKPWAITQSHYLCGLSGDEGQFAMGVRAFDIRLDDSGKLCHGDHSKTPSQKFMAKKQSGGDMTIGNVFAEMAKNLHNNSTEVVILLITNEHGSGSRTNVRNKVRDAINTYTAGWNGYSNYKGVYTGTTIPKLGDVRGKIVILDDGLSIEDNNPDNAFTKYIDYYYLKGRTIDGVKYTYENNYDLSSGDKWNKISAALTTCSGHMINCQINKSSRTAFSGNIWTNSNTVTSNPSDIDDDISPKRENYSWVRGAAYGIVWMDFVRTADSKPIITSNP